MKYIALLAILAIAACGPLPVDPSSPNPLDLPGGHEPTAAELHADNIRAITTPVLTQYRLQ